MAPTTQRRIVRFGTFELDLDNRRLTKSGYRIRLQEQPFQILALLLERQGQVVTREELKQTLWPGDTFVEFDDGLNTAIKKLRGALNDSSDSPRFIETVPRIGYRFVAPISDSVVLPSTGDAKLAARTEESADSALPAISASDPNVRPGLPPHGTVAISRHRIRLFAAVGIVLLLVLVGYATRTRWMPGRSAARPSTIQAIAVLPLLNVSSDSTQEYFADGMTDEIITDLAKLAGPKVISRTSAMLYKGTHKTIPEIARELHVGAVLEGSVERSGDRIRVRVQLIDASTDQHLWAEAYDRQLSDVLLLEAELAQDIASQIELRLTPQQQQSLAHNRSLNPQAFQDYLQGRHYWALRTDESLKTALNYFNRAIEEDPNDARSYAGLAQSYIVLPMLTTVTQDQAFPKAQEAAAKAVALDDSLAEAHLSIAEVRLYQYWDFPGAEKEFKRTLEINPNYSTGHQWYGEFLSLMGRHDEAIRELQVALALDPLSAVVHLQAANTFQQARQYDLALGQYHEALKIDPQFFPPFDGIYWVLRRQGKLAESIPYWQSAVKSWDTTGDMVKLADRLPVAYSTGGKEGYLHQCMKIHEHYGRPWLYVARDHADLGEPDPAFAALQKSYDNRETELLWLRIDPEFDSLRSDLRFQQLVRKVGFP